MSEPHRPDTGGTAASCDRVSCQRAATVLLLFDPRLTQAWLSDVDAASRTVGITLCLEHANKVTVPSGWTLTDERAAHNRVAGGAPAPVEAETESDAPAPVRLASVTPIAADPEPVAPMTVDEPEPDETDDARVPSAEKADDAETEAGEAGDDEVPGDDAASDEPPDADGVIERPTLWADDEPEGLRVDSSTPLLSRAFRAAHID